MSNEEFENLKFYQYGIYRANIIKTNIKHFRFNKLNNYTNVDLTEAKRQGLTIKLIVDNEPNFNNFLIKKVTIITEIFITITITIIMVISIRIGILLLSYSIYVLDLHMQLQFHIFL
jgi:hypothetical protein